MFPWQQRSFQTARNVSGSELVSSEGIGSGMKGNVLAPEKTTRVSEKGEDGESVWIRPLLHSSSLRQRNLELTQGGALGGRGRGRLAALDRKDSVWQTKLVEVLAEPPGQGGSEGAGLLQTPPTPVRHHAGWPVSSGHFLDARAYKMT